MNLNAMMIDQSDLCHWGTKLHRNKICRTHQRRISNICRCKKVINCMNKIKFNSKSRIKNFLTILLRENPKIAFLVIILNHSNLTNQKSIHLNQKLVWQVQNFWEVGDKTMMNIIMVLKKINFNSKKTSTFILTTLIRDEASQFYSLQNNLNNNNISP